MQADALDMEAEALESETTNAATSAGPEWIPVAKCGLPDKSVRRAIKRGDLRGSRMGRELFVNVADLAAWASNHQVCPDAEPVVVTSPVAMGPYERALAKAALKKVAALKKAS